MSNAIWHIIEYQTGYHHSITNYLDDFLFVHGNRNCCEQLTERFIKLCEEINFPVAQEKTEKATPRIVFLGILLDGHHRCLAVLELKVVRAVHLLQEIIDKRKTTVKQIQRLAGTLNFLTRAIHPG